MRIKSPKKKQKLLEVMWFDQIAEFDSLCEKISQKSSFSERWNLFLQMFSETDLSEYEMFLSPNGAEGAEHYKCTLTEGPFQSRSFSKNFFNQFHNDRKNTHFFFLKVFEVEREEDPLLELTFSQEGEVGELSWIQKGVHVSGSSVLALYKKFEKALKINTLYLYDDAKLRVNKSRQLQLRRIYPICSASGLPFYQEKSAFQPVSHPKITGTPSPTPLNQSAEMYTQTIRFFRNLSLEDLSKIAKYSGQKTFLNKMRRQFPFAKTMYELTSALFQQRNSPQYLSNLYQFQEKFLTTYLPPHRTSDFELTYVEALKTLENQCVFERKL